MIGKCYKAWYDDETSFRIIGESEGWWDVIIDDGHKSSVHMNYLDRYPEIPLLEWFTKKTFGI